MQACRHNVPGLNVSSSFSVGAIFWRESTNCHFYNILGYGPTDKLSPLHGPMQVQDREVTKH